jgi:hypothetical protein
MNLEIDFFPFVLSVQQIKDCQGTPVLPPRLPILTNGSDVQRRIGVVEEAGHIYIFIVVLTSYVITIPCSTFIPNVAHKGVKMGFILSCTVTARC